MKKIMLILVTIGMVISLLANDASHFKSKNGYIGGFVDKNIIYIYPGNKAYKMSSKAELSVLGSVARNEICKNPDTRRVIDMGYQVIFVYISRGFYQATAVTVDSCK